MCGNIMESAFAAKIELFKREKGWCYASVPSELSKPLEYLADRGLIAVTAISLGYVGFRLIAVSDKERLLSRTASFIGAFLFMGGSVAILLTSGDMTSTNMEGFAGVVAIGGWLFYYAKHSP